MNYLLNYGFFTAVSDGAEASFSFNILTPVGQNVLKGQSWHCGL